MSQHLARCGVREVVVALLEPGDLDENEAATGVVGGMRFSAVDAKPAATGRVNLHAAAAGVFAVDKALVDGLNAIDPAITLATLADMKHVDKGDMVATVKIIPFAVAGELVERAAALLAGAEIVQGASVPASVGWSCPDRASRHQGQRSRQDRPRHVASRLARSGSTIGEEVRVPHDAAALAEALAGACRAQRHGRGVRRVRDVRLRAT